MQIGILGATGPAGRALAARLGDLGEIVLVGSREQERAEGIVRSLGEQWGSRVAGLRAVTNQVAAREADIVVLALPWEVAPRLASDLAADLAGKIVISMANGLEKHGDGFIAVVPPDGSVAAGVARAAPEARVTAALHHVAARELASLGKEVEGDVLVCSDDRDAAATVCELVDRIPRLCALDVGGLGNAIGVEAFTAVMLSVNLRHRVRTGLRLTGMGR